MKDKDKTKAQLISELEELRQRVGEFEASEIDLKRAEKTLQQREESFRSLVERAEKALHQSEERFRSLVETTTDWFWEVDENSVYTYSSPKVHDILGYEPEEVLGKTPFDLMAPEEADRVADIFAPYAKSRKPFKLIENTNVHKDGHLVVLETSGIPVFDVKGVFRGYRGIDRDITERMQAEQATRESEMRLRTAIESLPFDFFIIDQNGRYVMQNSACKNRWGDVIGKRTEDLEVDEDNLTLWLNNNRRAFAGEVVRDEVKLKVGGGEGFFYNIIAPVTDRDQIPEILGVNIDITERKRAEEELRKAHDGLERRVEKRTAQLVEANKLLEEKIKELKRMERALHESHLLLEKTFASLDEAILVIEPHSRTILKVNPAVESVFGYSEEETLGRNTNFLHVDKVMYQKFGQELFLALDKDGVYRCEYRMRRKDGSIFFTEHNVSEIVDDSGRRVGVVSIVRDITERKRAEDELHNSLSLLSSTLESTADGILVVDRQGNIVSFNQKFVDIWGIPDSIISSKDDSQALAFVLDQLKDPEAFLAKVNDLYSRPETESYDTLEFKDGKILERYSQPQRKGEDIIGRVWSFRDVTERKQAEEGLRQSEEKYRLLVENVPSVVYRGYKDWSVDFFDDKVEVLTGHSMQEFNSRRIKWSDIVVEEDIAGARETFIEALKTDKSYMREYRIKAKSGGILWIQERARIICDDKGEIDYVSGVFFDITERKIAEEALRANEERLQRLLEASPDPIVVYDMKGRTTYINPAFEETFGWSSRELLGKNIEFVPDENWPETRAAIARMLRGERIQSFETRRLTKDGRILDIQLSSSVFHDQDKNPVGNIVILRDVSKRKRSEQALRESEHYFRSLLFNMHEGILVIDRGYRITDANNTLLVTTGLEYDEVIGRRCYAISHGYNEPCDRKGEDCLLREVFETGKPENFRHQHLRQDGPKAWVDILLSPLKDENGNVTHVIEAIRDVSDLVEMEEVLRESEENFRALVENANDGILIAAGKEGVNVYANKRAAEITGYSVTELLKIGLHELVAPDEVKKVADRYKRRLAGKNVPSQYETKLVRKSKEIFPAELSSARSAWKGEAASIILIRDITDRKRAEEAVRRSEAELVEKSRHLEEVNAALKVLLKQRENDKADLEERLLANVKELVMPYVEKLKNSRLHADEMTLVGILESNMKEIVSPFVTKLSSRFLSLTPTEIQVASLIKDGKTSKEIGALLNASENTVRTHRFHIRSKLGIKNKKVNFRSYLQSLQD
jgi:PAS domain S-box-containing protein